MFKSSEKTRVSLQVEYIFLKPQDTKKETNPMGEKKLIINSRSLYCQHFAKLIIE